MRLDKLLNRYFNDWRRDDSEASASAAVRSTRKIRRGRLLLSLEIEQTTGPAHKVNGAGQQENQNRRPDNRGKKGQRSIWGGLPTGSGS